MLVINKNPWFLPKENAKMQKLKEGPERSVHIFSSGVPILVYTYPRMLDG